MALFSFEASWGSSRAKARRIRLELDIGFALTTIAMLRSWLW